MSYGISLECANYIANVNIVQKMGINLCKLCMSLCVCVCQLDSIYGEAMAAAGGDGRHVKQRTLVKHTIECASGF